MSKHRASIQTALKGLTKAELEHLKTIITELQDEETKSEAKSDDVRSHVRKVRRERENP